MPRLPNQYVSIRKRFKKYFTALNNLGKTAREAGPLNEKTAQLIQLAGAAAIKSEGSVHSHARRALEAGAKPDELYHALLLLTSTIGFPAVSAALSWIEDIVAMDSDSKKVR
ncbi:MAG: carboxymuconolactone decarboxylase family protein [Nitrospirae bacterium]|nr:MAG: carboxymuconolactone decarboxylase family protein [Nitrospirota bacterium]